MNILPLLEEDMSRPLIRPEKIDRSLVEYIDILYQLMGIEIDYVTFQKMTDSERKSFVRDLKINKIVNGND